MRAPAYRPPRGLLPSWLIVAASLVVLAGGAIVWGIRYVRARVARELIIPAAAGDATPQTAGVPYADLLLPSGDHAIHAWWVRAPGPDSTTPAVLVFHGNGTSLSDQVGIQQVLFRAGVSSLGFDYAGFGTSTGRATPAALRQDARTAFAVFADSARRASRRVLLGTSLGAAVVLDAITDLQAGMDGVVLIGVFTSARDLAVQAGRVPRWLAFLLPNVYDNVAAIGRLERPVLLVHSTGDDVFPFDGAERLRDVAPVVKRLVRLDQTGHADYLSTDAGWRPVLDFIKRGLD